MFDFSEVDNARGVEAVRPGIGVSLQSRNRVAEISYPDEEVFAAAHQNDIDAGLINRSPRGAYACHRFRHFGQSVRRAIFDRKASDSSCDCLQDIFGDCAGIVGKACFEVGVQRQFGCSAQMAQMLEDFVAIQLPVAPPQ